MRMPPLDVIESPARTSWSPRRIVSVVAAVGLVAGLVWYLQRRPPTPEPAPAPSANRTNLPDRPVGVALPNDTNFGRVVLPSRPPRILDTSDGKNQPITGLPGTPDWNYVINVLSDRGYLVIAWPPEGLNIKAAAYLVDVSRGTAIHVASGQGIVPGADNRSILVVESSVDGDVVQRYGLDGHAIDKTFQVPPGRHLVCETAAGVVLAADQDPWELWDPATRAVAYTFQQFISATSDVLVSGDYDGSLTFTELKTGVTKQRQVPTDAGFLYEAAFSIDGRYLAITGVNNSFTAMTVGVFDRQADSFEFMRPFGITRAGAVTVIWNRDILTFVAHDTGTAVLWRPGGTAYTVTI